MRRKRWTCRRKREATRSMYGLDQKHTAEFGTRCLLARRLVERGVRFVQLYSGGGPVSVQWDAHKDLVGNHEKMCGMTDLPVAGLLKDLKQRGLLDSTLVIWGSEFGRLPMSQGGRRPRPQSARLHDVVRRRRREARHDRRRDRRDGAARRVGDALLTCAISTRRSCICSGLDQNRLWFLHNGRNEKLTDFGGTVIKDVLA